MALDSWEDIKTLRPNLVVAVSCSQSRNVREQTTCRKLFMSNMQYFQFVLWTPCGLLSEKIKALCENTESDPGRILNGTTGQVFS